MSFVDQTLTPQVRSGEAVATMTGRPRNLCPLAVIGPEVERLPAGAEMDVRLLTGPE